MNAKHLSKTALWYTPEWLIEKSRTVLGGKIDFDPASDEFGNSRVRAEQFLSEGGLEKPWPRVRSVFINPPGGKVGNKSQAALFWKRAVEEWVKGTFQHAIFIGFSIELMQTGQLINGAPPQAFSFCVPRNRFGFDNQEGMSKSSPSHAPMIVYIPAPQPEGTIDPDTRNLAFKKEFGELGYVR